jgi:ABC-type bacteriocin/lantibiotic exporter with double-glycine peptidase domain
MNYLGSLFNRNTVLFIREELTDRMLSLPQSFFDRNSPGYIMTRIESDIGGIGWLLSSSPLRIIENFIKLIGGLVLLFYLEWRAGFAAAVVMPFFIIISHFFSKRQYALATHHSEEYAKSGGSMEESISNINTVKALAEENNFKSRIMNHYHRLFHLGIEQHALNSFYQIIVNFFPQIARFLLLLFGGIWIIKGEWTLGSLLAAQAYIGFVFAPVQSLANANIHYQKSLASLKRLSQFYKITPEYNPGGREIKKLTGKVTFENLSFAYEAGRDVLKSISFTAAPGEKIALCGESGTGKSTLISLLMRFYLPSSGKILFDGIDAGEYDLKHLRRRIAYVSQQPELFTDTIAANIRLNNTAASDEEILQAIETAGLVKFIAERKDGINSMLEDKGANLSIGQKKRLIIARALVSESDIMIFDEPTAELDNETSHEILNKLNEAVKGKTLFVITHDPIVAEFCDKSLFIIKGHLENFAPHNEDRGKIKWKISVI